MSGPLRNIIESYEAQQANDDANARWLGAKQAWEAVLQVLMYDPTFGTNINEAGTLRTFTFQGAKSLDMPTVQVLYQDNNPYVEVLDLKYSEAQSYVQHQH